NNIMENEMTNAGIEMETKLSITAEGGNYLKVASGWATFLAVLGFIGTGFIVLAALLIMVMSPFIGSLSKFGGTFGFPMILMGVVYLLLGVVYFFPAYYLYNFANKIKIALINNNQKTLDESLKNLKKMFKYIGIMSIVLISLYLIMIPVMIFISFSKIWGL
ncbi:MAG: hypothetical protein ACYC25_08365, partial [Paludibacter sp.]